MVVVVIKETLFPALDEEEEDDDDEMKIGIQPALDSPSNVCIVFLDHKTEDLFFECLKPTERFLILYKIQ